MLFPKLLGIISAIFHYQIYLVIGNNNIPTTKLKNTNWPPHLNLAVMMRNGKYLSTENIIGFNVIHDGGSVNKAKCH